MSIFINVKMFLEEVLGSKARIKVLRTLFEKATAYTREELERETGLSTGAVHTALRGLERHGIVLELEGEGKQKLYKISRSTEDSIVKKLSEIFDWENFSERKESVPVHHWNRLAEVVRRLKKILKDKLSQVLLFGSLARGDVGPRSDIDLLIVSSEELEEDVRRDVRSELRGKWDVNFSLILRSLEQVESMKEEKTALYEEIQRDGVVIHRSRGSPELMV